MVYLTTHEKRRIIITILIVILVILGGVWAYIYMNPSTTATPTEETKTPTQETTKETTPSKEETSLGIASYTQYNTKENACIYYYEGGNCYVPLSFCVNNPEVKTSQELDQKKYCSETAALGAGTLKSPAGSQCPFTATEGDIINLYSIVEDPDENDPNPIYRYGPLGRLDIAFSAPFENSNGLWQTKTGDAGVHRFSVSVTDGQYTATKPYCIEVKPGNRPPVLSNLFDQTIVVGDLIALNPKCVDPDGDDVIITYMGEVGERDWLTSSSKKTEPKDIGEHAVTVTCRDNRGLPDYKTVEITVLAAPPSGTQTLKFVAEPKDITVNEGDTITLNPKVESGLGKPVKITYAGWMASSTKATTYSDAGEYKVTIIATDDVSTIQKTIKITVINVNRPPEIVGTEQKQH